MRKRSNDIHLFLSDKEYYDLRIKSVLSGLSMSDVIRLSMNSQTLNQTPPKDFIILLSKINNIGNNINQITKNFHIYDDIDLLYLRQCVISIENLVKEAKRKYL